jgi:hypothetical protein
VGVVAIGHVAVHARQALKSGPGGPIISFFTTAIKTIAIEKAANPRTSRETPPLAA